MSEPKKKNRSSNWSEDEKILLKKLIRKKIHIINDKNASTNTLLNKKKAWEEIHSRFNLLNSRERSLAELHNQWRNTKSILKMRYLANKHTSNNYKDELPNQPAKISQENTFVIQLLNEESNSEYISESPENLSTTKANSNIKTEQPNIEEMLSDDLNCQEGPYNLVTRQSEAKTLQKSEQKTAASIQRASRIINNKIHPIDYERQIFLKNIKAKKLEMDLCLKEHEERMEILKLEKEYWELKLAQLKQGH